MKNSPDNFIPTFGKESNERRPDSAEELAVLEEAAEISRGMDGNEATISRKVSEGLSSAARLKSVREELVRAAPETQAGLKPAVTGDETFRSEAAMANFKPQGKFRKFIHVALAGLGLLAGNTLQAADSKGVDRKPDSIAGGIPVFKSPMQSSTGTNVYNHQEEIWRPKTDAEKEKMLKVRAALEAQAASARAEKSSGTASYAQYRQRSESPIANAGVRPEINQNRPINTGHYPSYDDGRFPNTVNRQIPDNVQVIQGGGGIYYPEPSYPQHNYNYGMRGRYSGMPSTIYYGVPPGGQIPTEKRKLFGQEFEAITRDAALGISNSSDTRGGHYRGRYDSSPRSKKPKSR